MNGAALVALLYLVGGAPGVPEGPDHEAGCYLGDFDGGETRLVYDGPSEVPFYVGTPGALVRHGTAPVAPGVHDAESVQVHAAEVYEVTATCVVPDLEAEDPATQLVLAAGTLFVFHAEACDDDGICEAEADGVSFTMVEGTCDARKVPTVVPAGQVGWWVRAARDGVAGWVRGDAGFHIEARCVGADEGAPSSLLSWHRL